MKLERKVELISNSAGRLQSALKLARSPEWWAFMQKEAWLHLRRTLELLWLVLRKRQ